MQAQAWVVKRASTSPRDNPAYSEDFLRYLVTTYYVIGGEEGVRADVALAQAVKETAAFNFTGSVYPDQYNFAGIGAGVPGERWPTPEEGVRGHLRRLRLYAAPPSEIDETGAYDLSVLKRPLPRSYWGIAPYVEDLGARWAPSPTYGTSIVEDYLLPLINTRVTDYAGHWAETAIERALDSGLMGLFPDGTFGPDMPATRADIAVLILNLGAL